MKINKQSNSYQAIWVGIGSLSSFALAIVSAAVLSRYFDKTEYGTYRQILYVYNTLLIVFTAGLPRVFTYFLPRYTKEQGADIVFKISKLLFFFGMIFSIFLFVFSGIIAGILKNPELAVGLKWFSPIPMLLLPTLGIEGIFSTYKRTIYIAIYQTTTRLLMLLFIVLPVILFKGSYLNAIYGWIVVSLISFIIAVYFKKIPFKNILREKTPLSFKEILSYSLPLVGATVAGIAIKSADQFFISRYFGTEVFAEYVNGFIEIPFVGMVTGATSMVLMPQFSKMIHENESVSKIADLWKNALYKSALIIYPMVIFFIFNAKPIISILYSDVYENSVIYFQIAMFVNFFNIIVFAPLLFSMGKTKFYMITQTIFAFIVWTGEYLIVSVVGDPVFIAIFSVLMHSILIIVFFYKISTVLRVKIVNLFPYKISLFISLHSVFVIVLIIFTSSKFFDVENDIINISANFILYVTILLSTSKFIDVDYFSVIKPLFVKSK